MLCGMHLATRFNTDTTHVVLCRCWNLCFVYADTQGKTESVKTVLLDIAKLSQPSES